MENMICVRDLRFSYGRNRILDGLSFAAAPGECVVLAGPNGSGKSTVLSLLAGILRPDGGEITMHGRVGYVPQGNVLFADATVEENLRFFAGLARAPIPDTLPFSVERIKRKKVSALSGGMMKQVSIACAMMGEPEIILLDEPCAALDVDFRAEMTALVLNWRAQGKTVLYVGHDAAEFFDFCDRLVLLGEQTQIFEKKELPDDKNRFREEFEALIYQSKRK